MNVNEIRKEVKMKTICNTLCTMSLTIACFLFISGCSDKSDLERKAWFQCVSKYDRAMMQTWESDWALKDYSKVLKIKQKYLQISQPSETEIVSVLRSSSRNFQRVALVAMSIKPIETDQMADVLFEFLQDQDPVFRWYTLESLDKFSNFSEIKKADLGEKLVEIVRTRQDDELSPREFTLLANFPSEKAALFLTEQLMREGEERRISTFRYFAFKALKEMGNSYYDKAVKDMYKHGSSEMKKELLVWEKSLEENEMPKSEKNDIQLKR